MQRTRKSTAVAVLERLRARKVARALKHLKFRRWQRSGPSVAMSQSSTGYVWRWGQWVVTEIDPQATAGLQSARNYADVRDALTRRGVHHVVVSAHSMRPYVVAIADEHWAAAVAALEAELEGSAYYSRVKAKTWRGRKVTDLVHVTDKSFSPHFARASQLTIFCLTQKVARGAVLGERYGVTLQRWSPGESGNLYHRGGNDVAASVDPASFLQTRTVKNELGIDVSRLEADTRSEHERCQFPIDVVYMWVDGDDPVWKERRTTALGVSAEPEEQPLPESTGTWLFRDRNELMYSMRSLEEYLPWVRNIHLVTDDQVPKWLDLTNPRVKVHSHKDFFRDPAALPTFNSQAIGSQLHRVPDLSERYLVMNDDVFFAAPMEPEDFFTPSGLTKVRLSRRRSPIIPRESMSPIESSRLNSALLIEQMHGSRPTRLFAHTPIPQIKQVQNDLEARFSEEFDVTMRSKVRDHRDFELNSWLHLNHLLQNGGGVEADYAYDYFYLPLAHRRAQLSRAFHSQRVKVLCLNDGPSDVGDDYDSWLNALLNKVFPVPSRLELPAHEWRETVRHQPA